MSIYGNSEYFVLNDFIESSENIHSSFLSLNYSNEILFQNYNYVLTAKAKNKLDKLYTYISKDIPVLIEGETGTSKTLTSEIIYKYMFDIDIKDKNKKKKIYKV